MRNIILIGFMGCGKSTIGKKLSGRLELPVYDTDELIERNTGCRIAELFATKGEEAFRAMETDLLAELCEQKGRCIYATGGGVPLREENRQLLRQLGTVVWLRISPETAYQRLKNDTKRPILQGENPKEKIQELIVSREGAYTACADIIVDVDHKGREAIVEEILAAIEREAADETVGD